MIRLIAFDLDGTMLDENSVISDSTIESLKLLIDRGYAIASVSGRSVRRSLEPLVDHPDIAARMYVCGYNGAVIVGPQVDGRREQLYEQRLADEVFIELMDYVRDRGLNIVYCRCENSASGFVEEYRYVWATEEMLPSWTGAGFVTDGKLVERILAGEFGVPPKVMVMTGKQDRDATVADLQDRFGDALYLTWPLEDRIEVMHPDVDKGIALQTLARIVEIAPEQIMALGDGHNDLPMLRQAGIGILMGNALPSIQAAVEASGIHLGPALDEEGFTQMVQKYVIANDEPVRITADIPFITPPQWAILERSLIDLMNQAIEPVLERYLHGDGSTMWPPTDEMTNYDGLDDAYESFHNWPLFYLLGGADRVLEVANREFNAITLQFTRYESGHGHPMVVKEYEQGYDWMHQGEGYVFFYLLCMADPTNITNKRRARRFAGFYLNEDPEALNYDAQHKIIKSPHNGSKGPAYRNFERYYTKYRYENWRPWPLPFHDIPGCETVEDLKDPQIEDRMGQAVVERFARGDCAANLAAASMVTNAYLFTGDEKCKQWVEEYVGAWMDRVAVNDGILPDNVGLSGKVGEYLNGKWYGGYYGWTWPHGWHTMGDAVLSGAESALLVSGDQQYMELARSQIDLMMKNGEVRNGTLHAPHFHHDKGWDGYSPMQARFMAHLWSISMEPADMERIDKQRNHQARDWEKVAVQAPKDRGGHEAPWLAYLQGEFPDYPEEILRYNHAQVYQRLAYMAHDEQDPATYGDYYLQVRNPITAEGLVQLTMGGPLFSFNGGLLLVRLRYFDWQRQRPGLPQNVGALVEKLEPEGAVVQLVNLSAVEERELVIQAGAFGEHQFTTARFQSLAHGRSHDVFSGANWLDAGDYEAAMAKEVEENEVAVNAPYFRVVLKPGSQIRLDLGMKRFVNRPSYDLPWAAE